MFSRNSSIECSSDRVARLQEASGALLMAQLNVYAYGGVPLHAFMQACRLDVAVRLRDQCAAYGAATGRCMCVRTRAHGYIYVSC